jgi:hypothetical protein
LRSRSHRQGLGVQSSMWAAPTGRTTWSRERPEGLKNSDISPRLLAMGELSNRTLRNPSAARQDGATSLALSVGMSPVIDSTLRSEKLCAALLRLRHGRGLGLWCRGHGVQHVAQWISDSSQALGDKLAFLLTFRRSDPQPSGRHGFTSCLGSCRNARASQPIRT